MRNLVNICYQSMRPTNELIDAALAENPTPLAPLARPDNGTLFVVLHPLDEGWVVFTDDGDRLTATVSLADSPHDGMPRMFFRVEEQE